MLTDFSKLLNYMPDNSISQQPAQSHYNLRSTKRAGVKNDNPSQSDADRQFLNTNKESNSHESTGEPSQASSTQVVSQTGGNGISSQAGGTGIVSQSGDSVGTPLSAEISRGLIAQGILNSKPTPIIHSTDEEMEQAGLGDLSAEFRAYAQNNWFTRAFVKGWDGKPRQDSFLSLFFCLFLYLFLFLFLSLF
jgi:hypothetical protein